MTSEPELLPVRETLCYLPAWQDRHDYAQAEVAGRSLRLDLREALVKVEEQKHVFEAVYGVEKCFLDLNHDFRSPMFLIDRFYLVPNEAIYVEGTWTELGLFLRPGFQGVSPVLHYSKSAKPARKIKVSKMMQALEETPPLEEQRRGSLGCVCVNTPPTFAGTKHIPARPDFEENAGRYLQWLEAWKSGRRPRPEVPPSVDRSLIDRKATYERNMTERRQRWDELQQWLRENPETETN